MDIFSKDFALDAAIKEHGSKAVEVIGQALGEQVLYVDDAIKAGLSPNDYAKAQHYRTALMAAQSIVVLRYHALNK